MIAIDARTIEEIFTGEMGIKEVYAGEANVYTREGGYIYITLETMEGH